MNNSFSQGRSLTIDATITGSDTALVDPYDPQHKFNRLVYSKPNKPLWDIYSIDALKMLQAIEDDKLNTLYQITLLGRHIRPDHISTGGVGIWDILFNSAQQKAYTACIFAATNDYRPIPQSRVAMTSHFLDYSMLVSRVHKNQIIAGDRIGVGIHDISERIYYVLLYRVDDECQVPLSGRSQDRRPILQPAFNLTMEFAARIEYTGEATVVDMEEGREYNADEAGEFVSWITRSIKNVNQAFPFKPHFTPFVMNRINVPQMTERLDGDLEQAESISYDDFKDMCRQAYENAGAQRNNANLPLVEVVTLKDQNEIIVKLSDDHNPDGKSYLIEMSDIGDWTTEHYLNNEDLAGVDSEDYVGVISLPDHPEKGKRIGRYFQVNF